MLVVDTSVAVKWVVPESGDLEADTGIALDLLSRGLIAPDCIVGEFANALYKKVKRNEIGAEQARQSVDIVVDLIDLVPTTPLVANALDIALTLGHPVHDCIFLAMAAEFDLGLVTADEKFVRRCKQSGWDAPIYALRERGWP